MLWSLLIAMLPIYVPIIQDVKSQPIHWKQNEYRFQFPDILPDNPIRRHPNGRNQIRADSRRWPRQGMVMFYSRFQYNRKEICYLKKAVEFIQKYSCIPIFLFELNDRCANVYDTLSCIFFESDDNAGANTFYQMNVAGAPLDYYSYTGYVVISNGDGCSANLGRQGGRQELVINSGCFGYGTTGSAIHEMMHTLGYEHEHTRSDRDYYVTINLGNVHPEYRDNFYKVSNQEYRNFGPYDYVSLMHYPSNAFAINGNIPVIAATKGETRADMGQQSYLTFSDKVKIRSVTRCPGNTYEDHSKAIGDEEDTLVEASECQ